MKINKEARAPLRLITPVLKNSVFRFEEREQCKKNMLRLVKCLRMGNFNKDVGIVNCMRETDFATVAGDFVFKSFGLRLFVFLAVLLFFVSFSIAVTPFGAETVESINSTRATPDSAQSVLAQAGNTTELNIFGYSTTQAWQGYFGNVSGALILEDASGNAMYNWSLANPEGEIYATRSGSVDWGNVQCFNWSENGTWLESNFSINSDDVDGVDETFNEYQHEMFYSNNIEISEDSCMSTNIYDSSGASNDSHYEEVLLWDGTDVIFTSILEPEDVYGFDGRDHDFEMLVLEDGHGTDTSETAYYFYVELQ
jgi:hypothetical protein